MSTLKISKSTNGLFYQEGFNKTLSHLMEVQISLRKSSKDNDWVSYVDRSKMPKNKVVILWENNRWLLETGALVDINRFLLIFLIHFPSYAKHLSAVYTKQSSKHSNAKHISARLRAQLQTSQRCP